MEVKVVETLHKHNIIKVSTKQIFNRVLQEHKILI